MLDPGCALGPYKKFKIPHYLEYEKLDQYTTKILIESTDCDILFISHYHHDHFKPNLEDDEYINSSKNYFSSLYSGKKILCKQYRSKINFNQKKRGEKFHQDLMNLNVDSYRVGRDNFQEESSFYQRNCHLKIQSGLLDSFTVGNTHFLFPREFLHGMRTDAKEIFIQPLIIAYEEEFFYFFPDVQGMPSRDDYEFLIALKNELTAIHNQFFSDNESNHVIALGGPFTSLLRQQNTVHLLNQTLDNTIGIVKNFDEVILDHHLLRDSQFKNYWDILNSERGNIRLFNSNLFNELNFEKENIPILEFNRELLYKKYGK